jgi:hypothetical protein
MAKKGSRSDSCASVQDWLKRQPNEDRPALRRSVTRLKKLYIRQQHDDFVWWYDVGALVADLCPKEDRHYGENVINLLAQHLEPDQKPEGPRNFLYEARDFAVTCTAREARAFARARKANGDPLSKFHITALVSVKKKDQRKRFFDECLDQSWSVRRLRQAIQNAKGRKSSGGGREPQPPEPQSAGVAVRNISLMSRDWILNHKVWFKGASRPFRTVRKKDCDQAILNDARLAIKGLKEVHEATGNGLKQLRAFVKELEKKLSA